MLAVKSQLRKKPCGFNYLGIMLSHYKTFTESLVLYNKLLVSNNLFSFLTSPSFVSNSRETVLLFFTLINNSDPRGILSKVLRNFSNYPVVKVRSFFLKKPIHVSQIQSKCVYSITTHPLFLSYEDQFRSKSATLVGPSVPKRRLRRRRFQFHKEQNLFDRLILKSKKPRRRRVRLKKVNRTYVVQRIRKKLIDQFRKALDHDHNIHLLKRTKLRRKFSDSFYFKKLKPAPMYLFLRRSVYLRQMAGRNTSQFLRTACRKYLRRLRFKRRR